jgi:secondary thiamine-phosphate synthase enzyme
MKVRTEYLTFSTSGHADIRDLTSEIEAVIAREDGPANGIVTVFVPGATGAVTTVEYESGLLSDLKDLFEALIPRAHDYAHNDRWGDGNGHSHLRASLVGPSLTVPFVERKLTLGTWQQIVFIDFDVRARSRRLVLQIMGE